MLVYPPRTIIVRSVLRKTLGYRPGETCKMGKTVDPLTVLDERPSVRGVKGLRVADRYERDVHPQLRSHPDGWIMQLGKGAPRL